MLVLPKDLNFDNQKFAMIIAGYPGIGKTTLALSAPKPLLIDVEKGISRVKAEYRKSSLQIDSYEELKNDLDTLDLSPYETLIIDTGGELLDLMKPYVMKLNPQNGQRDGSLTLKGYGAVGAEFTRFIKKCKTMGKNIIVIFHAKEEKDEDRTKLRISIEGQSKDNIWKSIDIGGFMEVIGKRRTIGFSNSERYFAKGVHGVKGIYEIDELAPGVINTFVGNLFQGMKDTINSEKDIQIDEEKKYLEVMKLTNYINKVTTLEEVNSLVEKIKQAPHSLTSEKELKHKLNEKAKQINLTFNRKSGYYVVNNSDAS